MDLAQAKRFQDLLEPGVEQPTYLYSQIFSDDGFGVRSLSKKKFKLLRRIDPLLRRILIEEETVDFLTWGVQNSLMESFFLGSIMYYINRTAIVFTSHRIILIRIDRKNRPRDLIKQLRYDAIRSVGRSWTGNTNITTKSGMVRKFIKLPKRDHKFMQSTVEELIAADTLESSAVQSFENLCPHCFAAIAGRPLSCHKCGGGFKSADLATILSLIFPGLGDWYLGHRSIAVFEILMAALGWFLILLPPLDEYGREVSREPLPEFLVGLLLSFAIMHGLDAFVTRRIARTGIYPAAPPARNAEVRSETAGVDLSS